MNQIWSKVNYKMMESENLNKVTMREKNLKEYLRLGKQRSRSDGWIEIGDLNGKEIERDYIRVLNRIEKKRRERGVE